jgi:hypothetical protein
MPKAKKSVARSRSKSQAEIQQRSDQMTPRVYTGPLAWDKDEFEKAARDGRFITVELTEMQNLQLRGSYNLRKFLRIATHEQMEALRGSKPICITVSLRTENCAATSPPKILAMWGPGPGGVTNAMMRRNASYVEAELTRRGMNRMTRD